jgi:mannan polymerase II complex MNN10 subunit
MCDPIIDSLWNKPAFILQLLIREMLKPAKQRLEWIMWVDRDTMILDQCRPISSFLPPHSCNATAVNLLVTNDFNGLNNGVFILRVNEWAILLFTSIFAFRHFEPSIALPFTEQSAMEHLLATEDFAHQTRYVPQHWFNAYDYDGAAAYVVRGNGTEERSETVRKGDYLVHFAGHPEKERAIGEYEGVSEGAEDVWERSEVVRDVSGEVEAFWRGLGYLMMGRASSSPS